MSKIFDVNVLRVLAKVFNKVVSENKIAEDGTWHCITFSTIKKRAKHNVLIIKVLHCLTQAAACMSESSNNMVIHPQV